MWINRRIALTGHTSGIGKHFYDDSIARGLSVTGFSRSNGVDIVKIEDRKKLIGELENFDVFINNAAEGWAQVDLLYELFESWSNQQKLIVNIGSQSSKGNKTYVHKYAVEKAALDKAVHQLSSIPNCQCGIVLLQPSWVKTPRVAHCKTKDPFLETADVVTMLNWILGLPRGIRVSHLAFEATHSEPELEL